MTWPFQKGEIKEILNTVDRQIPLFDLTLKKDHMRGYYKYHVTSILAAISCMSQAIKDDIVRLDDDITEL